MKKWIIYSCCWLGGLPLAAQTTSLTVGEYRQKVLNYSQQIKQSAEQRIAMQEAMKTAKTAYLPQVNVSGNVQYLSLIHI